MYKHVYAAGRCFVACLCIGWISLVSAQTALTEMPNMPAFAGITADASALAVTDLDGNGTTDLAVGFTEGGTVQIVPNLGMKSATAEFLRLETGSDATVFDIIFRDVNKDLLPDALIASGAGIFIAVNQSTKGHIAFQPLSRVPGVDMAKVVAMVDLNMQGLPEIIVAEENQLSIIGLESDESAPLTTSMAAKHTFPAPIHGLRVADINGDGIIDIIAGTATGLVVLPNFTPYKAEKLQFGALVQVGERQNVHALDIADLNGDFRPDVVAGNYPSNTLSIWQNTSEGNTFSFSPAAHMEAFGSYTVAIGDFNADGWFDIAGISDRNAKQVLEVFMQVEGSHVQFDEPITFAPATGDLCISDVDGDGLDDITTYASTKNQAKVFTQKKPAGSKGLQTVGAFCNEDGAIQFDWLAAGMPANGAFLIERSIDGIVFEEIGRVTQVTPDATKAYSFTYIEQEIETVFYRIVAEQGEGGREFSTLMHLTPCVNVLIDFVCVFPNPVEDNMQFSYSVREEVSMEYMIIDLNMKTHLKDEKMIPAGPGSTNVLVENLPKGSYLFAVKFGNQSPQVCRFEKR